MRFLGICLLALGALYAQERGRGAGPPAPIKVAIPAFPDGGAIPVKYARSQTGNVSPAIEWSGVPQGAVTLALVLRDPDVPAQKGPDDTLHWLIYNIPAAATGLPENVPHDVNLADGSVQLKYTEGVPRLAVGTTGYFGPSPPPTPQPVLHHYVFELYALDTKLDASLQSREAVLNAMTGHVLARGAYFATYTNPPR